MTERRNEKSEFATCIVNNAPGLYWLHLSSREKGYPVHGHKMTRRDLRSLLAQIRAVLDGNYYVAGSLLQGRVGKEEIKRLWKRRSTR